jgi:anti-sigma28 factor (negative regulator of flagellin synthesis)
LAELENRSPDRSNTENGEGAADQRQSRIVELREQYADGSYWVEAAKLSAKIVDRHLKKPTSRGIRSRTPR